MGRLLLPTYRVYSRYFATSARTFITFFDERPFATLTKGNQSSHTRTPRHTRAQKVTHTHRRTWSNTHQRNLIVFGGRNIRLLIEKLAKSQALKLATTRRTAGQREVKRESERERGVV